MLANRLLPLLKELKTPPDHQFGFRKQHSTVEQIHRITHMISQTLEKKKYCSAVFLNIQQAFDKVWHEGLLYKIKKILPHPYYSILKSYLTNRQFIVKCLDATSATFPIESGIPQGSVLGTPYCSPSTLFFLCGEGKMLLRMPSDPHHWVMWESVGCRCHTH